jgi:uncharacterized protein
MKMATADGRYLPVLYPEESGFWAAVARHELALQECRSCANIWYPIGPVCPRCLSSDLSWKVLSGKGTISSYVIYHKAWAPWLGSRVPYVVAQVELAEGPRLTTNILDVAPTSVRIGMPVTVAFEQLTEEVAIVQFRPE